MINDNCFESFPILKSERLILRAITLEDAQYIQSIRNNPKVMEFMDSNNHETLEDSKQFIQNNITSFKNKEGIYWAIIEKQTEAFIGDFSYWRIDKKNHRAEIGYTLMPEFWGKGYMSEAIKTIINFGFNDLNLHSIEANINPNNNSSRKLLQKIGFEKEAYFKENYYYNGIYLDSEIYSLLKTNYTITHQ